MYLSFIVSTNGAATLFAFVYTHWNVSVCLIIIVALYECVGKVCICSFIFAVLVFISSAVSVFVSVVVFVSLALSVSASVCIYVLFNLCLYVQLYLYLQLHL